MHLHRAKKARKFRGQTSKSHEGDQPPNENKVQTDVTPDDYIKIISETELKDDEQLPSSVMTQWKAANDQDIFPKGLNRAMKCTVQAL